MAGNSALCGGKVDGEWSGVLEKVSDIPIIKYIKELSSREHCHECDFSSCRGVAEDVIFKGQFCHSRRGGIRKRRYRLEFLCWYWCGDSRGRTGLINGCRHIEKEDMRREGEGMEC